MSKKTNRAALQICFLIPEVKGMPNISGASIAAYSEAATLAKSGHKVTCIIFGLKTPEEMAILAQLKKSYCGKNLKLLFLPELEIHKTFLSPAYISHPYMAYAWLKNRNFDAIHFPVYSGIGHFICMAKRQGLAFADTTLCARAGGTTLWEKDQNNTFLSNVGNVATDFMERQSVASADVVICPSKNKLKWMRSDGWKLPKQSAIIRPIVEASNKPTGKKPANAKFKEIVFLGQLSPRKGLELFCKALNSIPEKHLKGISLTFIGAPLEIEKNPYQKSGETSIDFVKRIASSWPCKTKFLSNLNAEETREYIAKNGVLVVLPYAEHRTGMPLLDCLAKGVPFITCNSNMVAELLDKQSILRACFEPKPALLAAKIKDVLATGLIPPTSQGKAMQGAEETLAFHASLPLKSVIKEKASKAKKLPLVSICLTHYNRPEDLKRAIASIERQDYPNYEVVLVDDGSTTPEAIAYLENCEKYFKKKGWQLIRQQNKFQGAALNNAARHAKGEYLKLMDDDNIAGEKELSTFIKVAQASGADVLTCCSYFFSGDVPKKSDIPNLRLCVFIGPSIATGLFQNCYGDANSLIKRKVYLELGGLTEDYGPSHLDWEFFSRAALAGYKLEVVPEPLYFYRWPFSRDSNTSGANHYQSTKQELRAYLEVLPRELRPIFLLAVSMNKGDAARYPFATWAAKQPELKSSRSS